MIDSENLLPKILAKLLTVLANAELESDKIRLQISKVEDFNIKSAFSYIDRHGLERISKENLKDYLFEEEIDCSNDEVIDLIHTYDTTQTGCLDYQDFSRMLEVKVQSFLRKEDIASDDNSSNKGAKSLLRTFFEKEIILLRRIDPISHELRFAEGYNPKGLFSLIASKGRQYFDYSDLDKFMRTHGVLFSDAEIVAIFRRADIRNNGVINFIEFKKYILFHMSSLVEMVDDPLAEIKITQEPLRSNRSPIKDRISAFNNTNQFEANARNSRPFELLSEIDLKLTIKKPDTFSEFTFGKEMRGTYFRDHFQHFESSKPSDFYYFKHYFPNSTFKHYSHSLREFPKLERDFQQPMRSFYAVPKMADISTLKPLQATSPEFDRDEKIYNPVRPANLAHVMERWQVKKLEDAEIINADKIIGKADEFFRKRVAEITVHKPAYLP